MRNILGTYTPNYNLYMPEVGETGWGQLVSNNFEILDTNLNGLQNQIDVINTNIGDGTRVLVIPLQNTTINTSNFNNFAFYDENNVYIAQFGINTTFSSIPQPPHSCRLMIISVNGDATISGNIDTYPITLQSETPPGTPETNTYNNNINLVDYCYKITLTYTADQNNSILNMNQQDYLNFINNTIPYTPIFITQYLLSIPHAIANGGSGTRIYGNNGVAGTATNTCNGGGGGVLITDTHGRAGGTGCIFGQYSSGNSNDRGGGYGYRSPESNKYRCGLVIIVSGNLTITGKIIQNGGNGNSSNYGYGGGSYYFDNSNMYAYAGGGGAPVFIYYTGNYTNNGSINVNGGNYSYFGGSTSAGLGGAGGIKTTKITL